MMTVYVDSARIPATVGRIRGRWSHLTADTKDELYEFADRIGLNRDWFQTCKRRCGQVGVECVHWHFDVVEAKRTEAIAAGAQPIDIRELGAICTARRVQQPDARPPASRAERPSHAGAPTSPPRRSAPNDRLDTK